eukprot:2067886-Prymnesium_polylepis.3
MGPRQSEKSTRMFQTGQPRNRSRRLRLRPAPGRLSGRRWTCVCSRHAGPKWACCRRQTFARAAHAESPAPPRASAVES